MKLLVLNGPNLNLLGTRQPEVYGHMTLSGLEFGLVDAFPEVAFRFAQHNAEGALIDALHQAASDEIDGVIFNPGGYTHTSIALHDAIEAIAVPVIEVHLSNIHGREAFRRHSFVAPACAGHIAGLGARGYHLAVRYFLEEGAS